MPPGMAPQPKKKTPAQNQDGIWDEIEALAHGASDSASFGLADEAVGVGSATLKYLFGDMHGQSWDKARLAAQDEWRRKQNSSREQHPNLYRAGEVAGDYLPLLAGPAGAARLGGKQLLRRLEKVPGYAKDIAKDTAQGYGQGEGGTQERTTMQSKMP